MIRIGILGAARIAPKAVLQPAAALKHVSVVCVAASRPDKARRFAADNGLGDVADSYAALIARDDVDLVYNALTPRDHLQWSIAALKAGKHVLCEKPFAMNAVEAQQMVQQARLSRRHLLEAFHYRFHPLFRRIEQIVRSGQLGTVTEMTGRFAVLIAQQAGEFRYDPAMGGGATMDLGCYPVHWARTLMGGEPVVLKATAVEGKPGIDLSMKADLEFDGGRRAAIECSMAADQPGQVAATLGLAGAKGSLEVDNPLSPHAGHELRLTVNGETTREVVPGGTTFDYQMQHVLDVVANGAKPLTGGNDAVANMAVIDAIYSRAGLEPRGAVGIR